tara:strand:+ start:510 stop:740 length:231 start_codon:yes stop_codon:yes gene_type:complete
MGIYLSSVFAIIYYDEDNYENNDVKKNNKIKDNRQNDSNWLIVKQSCDCDNNYDCECNITSNSWGFFEDIEIGLYD